MLDFGAGELVVIGVVALVAIGPKELPGLLRTVGQAVGRLRRMAGDFQNQFNEALREADMAEAQKLIADIKTDVAGTTLPGGSLSPPVVMPSVPAEEAVNEGGATEPSTNPEMAVMPDGDHAGHGATGEPAITTEIAPAEPLAGDAFEKTVPAEPKRDTLS